jgi:hypothetical protein
MNWFQWFTLLLFITSTTSQLIGSKKRKKHKYKGAT